LPVLVAGIPDALKTEHRWALWRYVWRDDRWNKKQFQRSGRGADSTDHTTWCAFADALAASRHFDGISFALGDNWAGLDVDHFHSDPVWSPRFRALGAYAERSPGGEGIKIIGRSARIGGQLDFAHGEPTRSTWYAGRFFTITGQASQGDPGADLSAFIAEHFPTRTAPPVREGYRDAAITTDDDLLLQMIGSDNGAKVLALWRGDTGGHGGDHSRADQALCCYLAFWTNYDPDRIDRLFRLSGLMRPKWNSHSYRRATLDKALR